MGFSGEVCVEPERGLHSLSSLAYSEVPYINVSSLNPPFYPSTDISGRRHGHVVGNAVRMTPATQSSPFCCPLFLAAQQQWDLAC